MHSGNQLQTPWETTKDAPLTAGQVQGLSCS
jgi:hypothetical protein